MKSWYASKTLWFNVLACVVVIATALINIGVFKNPVVTCALGLIVAIGNIILRMFFTNQSIKSPFAPPSAST